MKRKQLQGSIQRVLNDTSKYVKKGQMENAYSILYKKSVLRVFLETEIKHMGK